LAVPKELAIRIDRMRRLGSAFDRAQAQAQRVCGDIAAEAPRQASEAALKRKVLSAPPLTKNCR
jgi:hypothetical protein